MPGRWRAVAAQPIPKIIRAPDIKVRPVFGEQVDGAPWKLPRESAVFNRNHTNQLLKLRFERLKKFFELSIHIAHYLKTANAAYTSRCPRVGRPRSRTLEYRLPRPSRATRRSAEPGRAFRPRELS